MDSTAEGGGRVLEDRFCVGCGREAATCGGCRRPLDPPRFCPECGRRLTVRVTPATVIANCRAHGTVGPS